MEEKKLITGYPHIDKMWIKNYDKSFLEKPLPKMTTLEYLKKCVGDKTNDTAISYFGKETSYEQLYQDIDNASKVFQELGVEDKKRVMTLIANIKEAAAIFYGIPQIGGEISYPDPRPDSIDLKISAKKLLSMIEQEKITHLVALDQCYLGMLKPVEHELKELGIDEVVIISASDSMDTKTTLSYLSEYAKFNGIKNLKIQLDKLKKYKGMMEEAKSKSCLKLLRYQDLLRECANSHFVAVPYEEDKLTIITHTSGTSSAKPKPIPLTNDNLNSYVHQTFGANMPMKDGDRALHILPYFAAFGAVDVVHAGLCHRNNLIQVPEFSPANLGKLIKKYKPQTIIGTPTWFLNMLTDPSLKNADLSFLTMATYGGDAMEEEDEIRINEFLKQHNSSCILTKGHGMSETCGCASYATDDYNKLGHFGIPMPNTVYALINPETKELVHFEEGQDKIEGEFIISSPTITSGVLDGEIITEHTSYDGLDFIYTKDLGCMDREGNMSFYSRKDRGFTRYDGFKVKPYEIEKVIKQHKDVKYCLVTSYFDEEKKGNMIMATLVLNTNAKLTDDEKTEFVRDLVEKCFVKNENVSSRQIPSKFIFKDNLEITAGGKVSIMGPINLTGEEVTVDLEETNISIGEIKIISPVNSEKVKKINLNI